MRVDLLQLKNDLQLHQIKHYLVPFISHTDQVPLLREVPFALYVRFKSNTQYCLVGPDRHPHYLDPPHPLDY